MRKNLNEFKLFDANVVDGTCVENIAINSKTNEVAYLKTTGCMIGVFNEDYNELIASDILKNVGFKAPKIELTTYNNENAWLSYNVLNENEYPFDLNFSNHGLKSEYHEHKFLEYINRIYDSCAQLGTERDRIFLEIMNVMFMNCFLDNYDFKSNNIKIAIDKLTQKATHVMCYDYGTAFNVHARQRNGIFYELSKEEIMQYLLKYYRPALEETINRIKTTITPEYVQDLLNGPDFENIDVTDYYENIINNLNYLNQLTNDDQVDYTR